MTGDKGLSVGTGPRLIGETGETTISSPPMSRRWCRSRRSSSIRVRIACRIAGSARPVHVSTPHFLCLEDHSNALLGRLRQGCVGTPGGRTGLTGKSRPVIKRVRMIRLFSLSAAGLLLTVSSIGAMAQMNSRPPSTTTMAPAPSQYTPSASPAMNGQLPPNTSGSVGTPTGNDINVFPGDATSPTLGNTGAAPGTAANPNR
jgi:hypothetical protein